MMRIKDFESLELIITWRILEIGFRSTEVFANQLSSEDIIDYAIGRMAETEICEVVELACESKDNAEDIQKCLSKLAKKECSRNEDELRKWTLAYVATHLPGESIDHVQGLIELGDIWSALHYPSDSPHIFQGRGNDLTPEEYYTPENYKLLLRIHQDWIRDELEQIKNLHKKISE